MKKIQELELKLDSYHYKVEDLEKYNIALQNENRNLQEKNKNLEIEFFDMTTSGKGKPKISSDLELMKMSNEELIRNIRILNMWNDATIQ